MSYWTRDWDNYHIRLCKTAKNLWNEVSGMVTHGNKKAERYLKWVRDEEQKVKDLKDEIRLLRKEDKEAWHPVE